MPSRKARKTRAPRTALPKTPSAKPATSLGAPGRARASSDMLTVAHLCDSFLANTRILVRAGEQSPKTLRWYEDQFKHLAPLAAFPADALKTYHLAAVKFTNAFTRALKRLYKWAADEDLVPKDPSRS
jgi:hypothetical protein